MSNSAGSTQAQDGLLKSIVKTGLWRFFPVLVTYALGFATLIPIIPVLTTNSFASSAAGYAIDCEDFTPQTAPEACINAHSTVVAWSSITGFFSNSILAFFAYPIIGHFSDKWGRKPFMYAGVILNALPFAVVYLHIHYGTSILWYFPISAISAVVSFFTLCLTACADLMEVSHRTSGNGFLLCTFSIGLLIGPALGGYLSPEDATTVTLALMAVTLLGTIVLVPDTAPAAVKRAREAAEAAAAAENTPDGVANIQETTVAKRDSGSILEGWRLVLSSAFYCRLAIVWVFVTIVIEGIYNILIQYLQLTLGFKKEDTAVLFILLSATGLAVKICVLPWCVPWLGEMKVLAISLLAYILETLALAAATTKSSAIAAVCIGSIGAMTYPTLITMQTSHVSPHKIGAVSGALHGAAAMASGLGPLFFAWLFSAFSRTDSPFPYFPQIVWLVLALLGVISELLVLSLAYYPQEGLLGEEEEDPTLEEGVGKVLRSEEEEGLLAGHVKGVTHNSDDVPYLVSMRSEQVIN